jgi:hypothetical protein
MPKRWVHSSFYAPGIYFKDATFGGNGVMYDPLRPGSAMGTGFRAIMAIDGATLNVLVNDKDGNPCADLWVLRDSRGESRRANWRRGW